MGTEWSYWRRSNPIASRSDYTDSVCITSYYQHKRFHTTYNRSVTVQARKSAKRSINQSNENIQTFLALLFLFFSLSSVIHHQKATLTHCTCPKFSMDSMRCPGSNNYPPIKTRIRYTDIYSWVVLMCVWMRLCIYMVVHEPVFYKEHSSAHQVLLLYLQGEMFPVWQSVCKMTINSFWYYDVLVDVVARCRC